MCVVCFIQLVIAALTYCHRIPSKIKFLMAPRSRIPEFELVRECECESSAKEKVGYSPKYADIYATLSGLSFAPSFLNENFTSLPCRLV